MSDETEKIEVIDHKLQDKADAFRESMRVVVKESLAKENEVLVIDDDAEIIVLKTKLSEVKGYMKIIGLVGLAFLEVQEWLQRAHPRLYLANTPFKEAKDDDEADEEYQN